MGERIATNLINAVYQLHIWNRTAEKCQSLVKKGAIAYNSPQETAQNAPIAIAMVTITLQVFFNGNTI